MVLKKFNKDIFLGVPLSTTEKEGKYYFSFSFLKNKRSVALLSQIRLFDAKRLLHKKGMISESDYSVVKQKITNLIER